MIRGFSVAAVALVALAGCTPTPTPSPTPEGCSPAVADISWEPAAGATESVVGVQKYRFESLDAAPTFEPIDLQTPARVDDAAVNALTALGSLNEDEWTAALFEAARADSDAGVDFGEILAIGDELLQITKPEVGDYVVTITAPRRSVVAVIDCGGAEPIRATLEGTNPTQAEAVPLRCVEGLEGDSIQAVTTREYCAAP